MYRYIYIVLNFALKTDDAGRYSYKKQPEICKWNLLKLAEAIKPIVPMNEMVKILDEYENIYEGFYNEQMRKKFGLSQTTLEPDK